MFSNEGLFRLFSIGLLGVLFVSVTALAEKEKKAVPQTFMTSVKTLEEVEQINNDQLHANNFTSIGDRVEVIAPTPEKK